jgi:alpha-ketoglutarate-dependent taurine dioxygenase
MKISPMTPALGAEISGIDVRRLQPADFDALRETWLRYKLVCMRDQQLDLDDLLRFSERLLASLYQHCTRAEFGCRFKWTAGSLVMWDNRSTLHYAVNDYDGYRRCLYRTTVAGHPPQPA